MLETGQSVEVRTLYDGTWAGGFVTTAPAGDGWWVRRYDGVTLPWPLPASEVRPSP